MNEIISKEEEKTLARAKLTPYEQYAKKILPYAPDNMQEELRKGLKLLFEKDRDVFKNSIGSIRTAIKLGLDLNPDAKQVYLIPIKGVYKVIVTREGYAELFPEYIIQGQAVYENDFCEIMQGDVNSVVHKPKLSDRGKIIGAWASVSRPVNGVMEKYITYLDRDMINQIRKTLNGRQSAWDGFESEMAIKSAIRRVMKALPKGSAKEKYLEVETLDNESFQTIETNNDESSADTNVMANIQEVKDGQNN